MNVGWYDTNMGRGYPFLSDTTGVQEVGGGLPAELPDLSYMPNTVIVDAGFIIGPAIAFDPAEDVIYLDSVSLESGELSFVFKSTASSLSGVTWTFTRLEGDPKFATELVEAVSDCGVQVVTSGFLVTGDLDVFWEHLADGETSGGEALSIEPAVVRSLNGGALGSINLANIARTYVTAPEGCREPCFDFEPQDVYVREECITGPIRIKDGYNNAVVQNIGDNSLQFSARVGGGRGEPCDEISLFDGETPPQGSQLLSGGHECSETIRTINGSGAKIFSLVGGPSVIVELAEGDDSQIRIRIGDEEEPSEDCAEPEESEDPCDCGEA